MDDGSGNLGDRLCQETATGWLGLCWYIATDAICWFCITWKNKQEYYQNTDQAKNYLFT